MDEPVIDCNETLQKLYLFLDRELTTQEEAEVLGHLNQCPDCGEHVKFEEHVRMKVRNCCNDEAPVYLKQRILRLR